MLDGRSVGSEVGGVPSGVCRTEDEGECRRFLFGDDAKEPAKANERVADPIDIGLFFALRNGDP